MNTYCTFESLRYKWNFSEVGLYRRLDFFESNWSFFAGFGNVLFRWLCYVKLHGHGKTVWWCLSKYNLMLKGKQKR